MALSPALMSPSGFILLWLLGFSFTPFMGVVFERLIRSKLRQG